MLLSDIGEDYRQGCPSLNRDRSVFNCHGGAVVRHLPPTSEVGGSISGPYGGRLVVSYKFLQKLD